MLLAESRLHAALEIESRFRPTGVLSTPKAEVNHGALSVKPAERGTLASHAVEVCLSRARFYQAKTGDNVHHSSLSMLLAEHWLLPARRTEGRHGHAGIMCARLADDVHHAVPRMLCAQYRRLAAFDIVVRDLVAPIL